MVWKSGYRVKAAILHLHDEDSSVSMTSGHYVTALCQNGQWHLANDEFVRNVEMKECLVVPCGVLFERCDDQCSGKSMLFEGMVSQQHSWFECLCKAAPALPAAGHVTEAAASVDGTQPVFTGAVRTHAASSQDGPEASRSKRKAADASQGNCLLKYFKPVGSIEQQKEAVDAQRSREQDRSTKEQDRSTREQDRSTRGQDRSTNEQDCSTREQDRSTREQDCSTREQDRSTREQNRSTRLQDRATREQDRATRKQDRATREQDRSTREQDRSTREQDRSTREQGCRQDDRASREQDRSRRGLKLARERTEKDHVDPFMLDQTPLALFAKRYIIFLCDLDLITICGHSQMLRRTCRPFHVCCKGVKTNGLQT